MNIDTPQLLMGQLGVDEASDLRAVLLCAISMFLCTSGSADMVQHGGGSQESLPSVSDKDHYRIEAGMSAGAWRAIKEDGGLMVRKEIVVLMAAWCRNGGATLCCAGGYTGRRTVAWMRARPEGRFRTMASLMQ